MVRSLDVAFTVGASIAALALVGLAVIALRARRHSRANALLATFAVAGAINMATAYSWVLVPDRTVAYNVELWSVIVSFVYVAAYLSFIGVAVRSPLARPFASASANIVLFALAAAFAAFALLRPGAIISSFDRDATGDWSSTFGPAFLAPQALLGVALGAYSFICALDARRRTIQGTVARAQAHAYLVAFVVADAAVFVDNAAILLLPQGLYKILDGVLFPISFVVFAALLVRGMVRYQLFDFDLKLKLNIKRGTLAAIFVAVFFVVAQLIQNFASTELGWLAGAVAAGILLFAISPLQRVAERVADTAMPRTTGTPDYIAFKKLEVYKAAVETAFESGFGIDARERTTLDRLREKLGLRDDDASAVENEVRERFAPTQA